MRNGLKFIGLAAVAALSLTALAIQEGVILKRTPKVGDQAKYHLKAEFEANGQPSSFSATITDKVTKVADNGNYTVESATSEARVNLGGTDIDPGDSANQLTTTTFSKSNEVISVESSQADPAQMRMANMQNIKFPDTPLKVGDSWTIEIKKGDKGGNPVKGKFTVEGRETIGGFDSLKIRGSAKETIEQDPMGMEGTYWISVKDASLVKAVGTITNAPIPQLGPLNMKISMIREGVN